MTGWWWLPSAPWVPLGFAARPLVRPQPRRSWELGPDEMSVAAFLPVRSGSCVRLFVSSAFATYRLPFPSGLRADAFAHTVSRPSHSFASLGVRLAERRVFSL